MSDVSMGYSVTLQKSGLAMDYYFCTIYKNTPEGLVQFFERDICGSDLPNFTIPLPSSSLADWSFGVVGFREETGDTPLCQKVIKLQELVQSGSVFLS
ncbi:MAG: hypothetical protein Q8L98_06845 [Chlamydiales bacterium]|nr:hypothetical protein [Chlamydiales bacterium]